MRLHAVTILVDDYDEAIAHYVDDLGFTLVEDTALTPEKRWVRVAPDPAGATSIILAVATTDDQRAAIGRQTGGRVGLFLHTDDFAADHARMVARGVEMTEEPRHEPYGTVVVLRDRYGNLWDLIQPADG
ncbi:VOC family protein [Aeromicrobium sp.]|uniref:VOC family protein n=1 Tax=Aeromicrobium sp. TaxID=1871063 RepID=UPI00351725ED